MWLRDVTQAKYRICWTFAPRLGFHKSLKLKCIRIIETREDLAPCWAHEAAWKKGTKKTDKI